MKLIPLIKESSHHESSYQSQWTLVQTVPKTHLNIVCLCQKATKNYRFYFNKINGNVIIIGLDCRENHYESFSSIGLEDKCQNSLLNFFLKELNLQTSLNIFLKTGKNPEISIQRTINKTIEEAVSHADPVVSLGETVNLFQLLSEIIDVIKYKKFLLGKAEKLKLKLVIQIIEPKEMESRIKIINESETEFNKINEQYRIFQQKRDLVLAEQYLKDIPTIISNNLQQAYPLPGELWQLQQTNGYQKWLSGAVLEFN